MLVTDPKEKANCICKNIPLLKIIQNVSKKKQQSKVQKKKNPPNLSSERHESI